MNPITPTNPKGAGAVAGPCTQTKRLIKSLALHIRERVDFDRIVDKLVMMSEGVDPSTGSPIDVKDAQAAIKILLERGFGMAPLHVALEGSIRNELVLSQPRAQRPVMTLEQINERRKALRALGIKPKIIDAESAPALTEGEGAGTDDE